LKRLESSDRLKISFLSNVNSDEGETWIDIESYSNSILKMPDSRQHAFVVDDLEALELLCPSNSIARAFLLKVCKSCKANDSKVTALSRGSAVHSVIVYGRKCSNSHEFTSGSWSISDSSSSSSSSNSNKLLNPPLDHNLSPALSEYMRYR